MTDNVTAEKEKAEKGLPLWMPLVGLIIAFLFAIFVGGRICPTLYGIVLPPEPPLPSGDNVMTLHESKGTGLDEWVYEITKTGCEVARFYETYLQTCVYDPDSGCGVPNGGLPQVGVSGLFTAECTGVQTIGIYKVKWTVYISTAYSTGKWTHYRVIREIGN